MKFFNEFQPRDNLLIFFFFFNANRQIRVGYLKRGKGIVYFGKSVIKLNILAAP